MAKLKLNLRGFFRKEAKNLISVFKRLITLKKGVRSDDSPDNRPSTIRKKGKNHWLSDTDETRKRMFGDTIKNLGFSVFAKNSPHSGKNTYISKKGKKTYINKTPPTYREIMELWNQDRYSGIFGNELPVGSQLPERLGKEVDKQLRGQIIKRFDKAVKKANRKNRRRR